jgi:hypothetical protein
MREIIFATVTMLSKCLTNFKNFKMKIFCVFICFIFYFSDCFGQNINIQKLITGTWKGPYYLTFNDSSEAAIASSVYYEFGKKGKCFIQCVGVGEITAGVLTYKLKTDSIYFFRESKPFLTRHIKFISSDRFMLTDKSKKLKSFFTLEKSD